MDGPKDRLGRMSQSRRAPPIMGTLGMRLVAAKGGRAWLKLRVGKKFHNPMGTVHGGIMTDLADAAMGIAVMTTLGAGESFTTLELKMNFLRPVVDDELTAEARVLHRGRTIALVESVLKNKRGKEVARGVATQMILRVGATFLSPPRSERSRAVR